ncbi:L-ribulose-5-phosphate 4-epimerase UlaF [Striga asiatica]|uniref:L-ribulose-5-phosphate 4-epimerase UlaF n=1 Tax=Striga asiatica TaxID=4170 RepID=A0A5A7QRC7_STRAF|nr:L-ribulose-5-phosphate 4-epimerase UlaF [Striga asiatica]
MYMFFDEESQDFDPDAGDFYDGPPIFDEEPPVTDKHLCKDMDMKIPFVLSIGALDVVNFGPEDTILLQFQDGKFFEHTNQMGVSGLDSPGKAFYDPAATGALVVDLQRLIELYEYREVKVFPEHVNVMQFDVLDGSVELVGRYSTFVHDSGMAIPTLGTTLVSARLEPYLGEKADGDEIHSDSKANHPQPGEDDGDEIALAFLEKYERRRRHT